MKRLARPWLSAQVLAAMALVLGGLHAANRSTDGQSASPPRSSPARLFSGERQPPSLDLTDGAAPPRRLAEHQLPEVASDGVDVPPPEEPDHLLTAGQFKRPTDTLPAPQQLRPQPSSAATDEPTTVEVAAPRRLAPPTRPVSESATPPLKPASPSALDRLKPTPIFPRAAKAAERLKTTPLATEPAPSLSDQPLAAPGPLANGPIADTPQSNTAQPTGPVTGDPAAKSGETTSPVQPTPTQPTTPSTPQPTPAPALLAPSPSSSSDPSPALTPPTREAAPPTIPLPVPAAKAGEASPSSAGPTLVAPDGDQAPAQPTSPPADKPKGNQDRTEKPDSTSPVTENRVTEKPAAKQPAAESVPSVKPEATTPSPVPKPEPAPASSGTDAPRLEAPQAEAARTESANPGNAKSEPGPLLSNPSAADSGGSNKGNTEPKNVPALKDPLPATPSTPDDQPIKPSLPPLPKSEGEPGTKPSEKPSAPSKDSTPPARPADQPAPDTTTPKATEPDKPAPEPRDPLLNLVDQAINVTTQRELRVGVNSPWQIVHGVVALRWDLRLQTADGKGTVSGIEWLMGGNSFEGQSLWQATQWGGRGHPYTRPYAHEGHPTQFLGYMTMANIPLDYEVQTDTKIVTVRDIINDAKMQVRQGPEITWTLWALAHYEEPDAQWYNSAGEAWSIERLVKMQIEEQVTRGACGGCHGLFALCYARNIYLTQGKQLRGVWYEADNKIKTYAEYSRRMQNRDGSFSSNFYKSPGFSSDFSSRLNTTGHQLEWIMVALPQSRLKEQWVRNAVECLSRDLIINARNPSDTGPMYHSLHALILYRQRLDPNYLVPKRNSPLKLIERNRAEPIAKQPGIPQAAVAPQSPVPSGNPTPVSHPDPVPEGKATPVARTEPAAEGLRPVSKPTALRAVPVPRTLPRSAGSAAPVDGRDIDP